MVLEALEVLGWNHNMVTVSQPLLSEMGGPLSLALSKFITPQQQSGYIN